MSKDPKTKGHDPDEKNEVEGRDAQGRTQQEIDPGAARQGQSRQAMDRDQARSVGQGRTRQEVDQEDPPRPVPREMLQPSTSVGPVTDQQIDHWFADRKPSGSQMSNQTVIRDAGKVFAKAVLSHTNPGPDQTAAIRKIREVVMTAGMCLKGGD